MALTQTHLDLRASISNKLVALADEKASLAEDVARYASIGTITNGDGGAASTGEAAVVVDSLTELLDATEGDPDFGGVAPSFASSTIAGGNLSTTEISVATVADLLASPEIILRPQPSGSDINVSAWAKLAPTSDRLIGGLRHPQVRVKLGVIPAAARGAFSGSYKLVVQNPLDTATAEVVSTGAATFTYAG